MSTRPTHIAVHDYSGHPGQAQLSRSLAGLGYQVTHQHCPSYATGKGAVERMHGDPVSLVFEECSLADEFERYSMPRRIRQEISYGLKAGRMIASGEPDVAIISNVPLLAHLLVDLRLRRRRIPTIFWHQDIYSAAVGEAARRRIPVVGGVVARLADRVERHIARSSGAVVAISPTFLAKLSEWGVAEKSTVIPNWAPIDELPVLDRRNVWSQRMGLSSVPVVLYSGTLGLKHDPSIVSVISERLRTTHPTARVVVISEGKGRQWLETWRQVNQAENLMLLDYQKYPDLPSVLASADVLLAVLEPGASVFSVPSKVLTYLCAERPIVGVMPRGNSVAEILLEHQAGLVVDPSEREAIPEAVTRLLDNPEEARTMGRAGRTYAEREFSPLNAALRFESIFSQWVTIPARPVDPDVVPVDHDAPLPMEV